jgi:ABC-type nitrate/sulfonate/bicarbonate transport system substrate-binding protein
MKWSFAGTMAPYFAAQGNGIFTENGLNVVLSEGGRARPTSIQQVALGQAAFGITGAHELAEARAQDQPVVSLAVIFKKSPVCLLTTTDRRIVSPGDLVGRTVEMTTGDNAEFEYLAMLRLAGVAPETVNQVPWQYTYQGLLAGTSDAVVAYENDQPIVLQAEFAEKGKTLSLLCPREYGVTPYADVLFTTEDLIQRDPALVGRVVDAFLEAWEWANVHVERTAKYFAESPLLRDRGIDPVIQMAVLRKSLDFVRGTEGGVEMGGHISLIGLHERERWEETVELLRTYGGVEKLPPPEALFTNRWVQQHEMQRVGDGQAP